MKKTALLIILASAPFAMQAQFTITKIEPSSMSVKDSPDTIKGTTYTNEYYNEAFKLAEKKRIRKERNTIEFNSGLQLTETRFENWAAGGDNTFSGRAGIYFRHQYKRGEFALDYKAEARYGLNVIDDKVFKNEDEFKLNILSTWRMSGNWSYAATGNIRSQFSRGQKSRTDTTTVSNFMAPGFIDVSVGFNYHREGSPFSLTLSPLTGNIILVLDDYLASKGTNGVDPGKHSKGQLGPSIRADYDKEFYKKIFRYRSSLYSFTNLKSDPIVRWENTFEIRATRFFTTSLYWLLYYDKYATTPKPEKLQVNYAISLGLTYRFKNK